jgi:hypothetical protein
MKTTSLFSCIIVGSSLLAGPTFAQSSVSVKGQFMTGQSSSEWLGSKLIGLNIYDEKNNKIGAVDQLLVDRNGLIEGVVIGVGGFLGVDKKNVALPFKSLRWESQKAADSGNATTGSNTSATTTSTDTSKNYPDHAVLNTTKDELKSAPNFHYAGDKDK